MYKNLILSLAAFVAFSTASFAQDYNVEVEEERQNNRLLLNAVNKSLTDLDVSIEVKGTGFRQRKGVPRKVRVPATSKVNLISLIVERGKTPVYTYELNVSDSLSRRVIKREFEKIRIHPKKPITIYMPDNCTNCDSIVNPLENTTPYIYKAIKISESAAAQAQLERSFANTSRPLETIDTAIITLGGSMYLYIATFEEMMAKLEEEE